MKHFFLYSIYGWSAFFCLSAPLAACAAGYDMPYRVALPAVPDAWTVVLGDNRWHIEWINSNGTREIRDVDGREATESGVVSAGAGLEIHILQELATPVIAYPYWSGKDIAPDVMRPAGAIFPSDADVSSGTISLSWTGGVEAVLYAELARSASHAERDSTRQPQYFDWRRFRELLESAAIPENVRLDPWLADWKAIAEKTASSGFDRRRITAITRREIAVPALPGEIWIGTSPFAPPIAAPAETEKTLVLLANDAVDTYISKEGVLRVSSSAWIWTPWQLY
ncbi:MAG: hypothetical protein LBB48_01925 [Treponema sp.]|jgi:hypothetical protein|nr:hypothetical protein [Treponema sp.]